MKERILKVLKVYADSELNIASPVAREMLATALMEAIEYSQTKEQQTMVDQMSDPE
jgi:hypothetical protein